jgi:hypothetical protein
MIRRSQKLRMNGLNRRPLRHIFRQPDKARPRLSHSRSQARLPCKSVLRRSVLRHQASMSTRRHREFSIPTQLRQSLRLARSIHRKKQLPLRRIAADLRLRRHERSQPNHRKNCRPDHRSHVDLPCKILTRSFPFPLASKPCTLTNVTITPRANTHFGASFFPSGAGGLANFASSTGTFTFTSLTWIVNLPPGRASVQRNGIFTPLASR